MVNKTDILDVLKTIPDPEMPISITDLGLIEHVSMDDSIVHIELLPTFIGCIALPAIAEEIKRKLGTLEGVSSVEVEFIYDPPWSTDRISDDGIASLAEHGIAVPAGSSACCGGKKSTSVELQTSVIPCPWCGSGETTITSPFGPTRCKSIHFCNACRHPFERMKKL
jgi:ring-1,2-phenylacetyl-CoA epoxidase subunit PaaD